MDRSSALHCLQRCTRQDGIAVAQVHVYVCICVQSVCVYSNATNWKNREKERKDNTDQRSQHRLPFSLTLSLSVLIRTYGYINIKCAIRNGVTALPLSLHIIQCVPLYIQRESERDTYLRVNIGRHMHKARKEKGRGTIEVKGSFRLVFLSLHRSKWKDDTLLFVSICIDQEKREREREREMQASRLPLLSIFAKTTKERQRDQGSQLPLSPLLCMQLATPSSFLYLFVIFGMREILSDLAIPDLPAFTDTDRGFEILHFSLFWH